MTDQTTAGDAFLFDVRPATAWVNDIQKQITVGGQKNFRAPNPDPGTAISYWLKGDAGNVRVDISDVTGRVVRTIDGTKTLGAQSRALEPAGHAAPDAAARRRAADRPTSRPQPRRRRSRRRRIRRPTPPAAGQQGAGREDRPATAPPRCARRSRRAAPVRRAAAPRRPRRRAAVVAAAVEAAAASAPPRFPRAPISSR